MIIANIFRVIGLAATAAYLVGCATPPESNGLPEGYQGPAATVTDTYEQLDRMSAHMFYVHAVDGRAVANVVTETARASSGQAGRLTMIGKERQVPVQALELNIVGQVYHGAPIGFMLNSGGNYRVEGTIDFIPEPDALYLVRGELGSDYSAVWLEDVDGNVVSEVIEVGAKPAAGGTHAADEVGANEAPSVGSTPAQIFAGINSGESASVVESKLGKPDSIIERKASAFSRHPSQAVYTYLGLGTITFTDRNGMYVDHIRPVLAGEDEFDTLKSQVMQSEGASLQRIAKQLYHRGISDTQTLDLLADKIWLHNDSGNDFTIDAVAWLSKILGESGNARYTTFLNFVADKAGSRKLRKYATQSAKLLPAASGEQYQPN